MRPLNVPLKTCRDCIEPVGRINDVKAPKHGALKRPTARLPSDFRLAMLRRSDIVLNPTKFAGDNAVNPVEKACKETLPYALEVFPMESIRHTAKAVLGVKRVEAGAPLANDTVEHKLEVVGP